MRDDLPESRMSWKDYAMLHVALLPFYLLLVALVFALWDNSGWLFPTSGHIGG